MDIILLDGSPKSKGSTSECILKAVEERLSGNKIEWCNARKYDIKSLSEMIINSKVLVIIFPLYVDGIPSHLLRLLEELQTVLMDEEKDVMVYVIVNNGFYEAKQNKLALEMMRLWTEKSGLKWGAGMGIGAGAMMQAAPIGKGPLTSIGKVLYGFTENIQKKKSESDVFAEPNFPRFLYKGMAHIGWRRQAKGNGISRKELHKKLV